MVLKWWVTPKIKILPIYTQPHVIPKKKLSSADTILFMNEWILYGLYLFENIAFFVLQEKRYPVLITDTQIQIWKNMVIELKFLGDLYL